MKQKFTIPCSLVILILLSANQLSLAANQELTKATDSNSRQLIKNQCHRIANKLGSVNLSDCLSARLQASDGVSVKQAPIMVREYLPLLHRKPQGKVLLLGGLHGDEYASVSIIFKWLKTLNKHHSGLFHWKIAPVSNPDGLLQKRSQRLNQNGVDLNRNFPTPNWEEESEHYWKVRTRSNPRRYPGPNALSEPETQWLVNEIDRFQPDVIVSVHAPFGILDFDTSNYSQSPPDRLGSLRLNMLGTYPGSLGNYAGVQKGIPVITIELPSAGIMPNPREVSRIWTDLISWLKNNVGIETYQQTVEHLGKNYTGPS